MSLGDRYCSTITKLIRLGRCLSLMTWLIGYEHVTQRTHAVASRVSKEAEGTSCKDMMRSLEPCSWLHSSYFLLISSPSWRQEAHRGATSPG